MGLQYVYAPNDDKDNVDPPKLTFLGVGGGVVIFVWGLWFSSFLAVVLLLQLYVGGVLKMVEVTRSLELLLLLLLLLVLFVLLLLEDGDWAIMFLYLIQ
jgi:hypothetical protein